MRNHCLHNNFVGSIIPELKNRVTKLSYSLLASQTELLTLIFFKFFELVTRCEKNFSIVSELVIQHFKENKISVLLTRKIKNN